MKWNKRDTPEVTRHRLLEGILLRLARLPDADRFVLRGGMLLRHWFRPLDRPAADLDLASTLSFSVEETAKRFVPLLADRGIADGVTFNTERFRIEPIWLNTDFPGVRIFAFGLANGCEGEFSIDVTYGEPLVPEPELHDYPTLCRRMSARVWMCRPETIIGRKLHAIWHMGMMHWRPKDLNDLRLIFERVPIRANMLQEAITLSYTSRGEAPAEARLIFGPDSWWKMKMSVARWHDFFEASPGSKVPYELSKVVAYVAERLNPVLECLR